MLPPATKGSRGVPGGPEHVLDPGLLVVHVPEELVQAMGFIQPGSPGGRHALDLLETTVDSVPLVFHSGGVEGTAGHQAVCLAVQVLQAILGQGTWWQGSGIRVSGNTCLKLRAGCLADRLVSGLFAAEC